MALRRNPGCAAMLRAVAASTALAGMLGALLAACAQAPSGPHAPGIGRDAEAPGLQQAWVQQSADRGWTVRAITAAAHCPGLRWTANDAAQAAGRTQMEARAAAAVVAPRPGATQGPPRDAVFALRSCEAPWPIGAAQVQVGPFTLSAPAAEIRRIALIGDTGCRLKQSEVAFQDCNDAQRWPFAAISRSAASTQPDLVIHLGDLHYRESPCAIDPVTRTERPGCFGSPWGYGDDAWQADFFRPAAPLLAAAPWLIVRGNHESCGRAGVGWHRYLAAEAFAGARSCQDPARDAEADFTAPYAVALSADSQLIVFDSSFAAGQAYPPDDPVFKRYAAQLLRARQLAAAKPHSVWLNHHPVLGFGPSDQGQPRPGSAGLLSVMAAVEPGRLYADGIDLVLNGHVHLFEALGFASDHPATLVLGNAGSAMSGFVDEARALQSQPAPGAVLDTFASHRAFGFATLDRVASGWQLTAWSVSGQALRRCRLQAAKLTCEPAAAAQ